MLCIQLVQLFDRTVMRHLLTYASDHGDGATRILTALRMLLSSSAETMILSSLSLTPVLIAVSSFISIDMRDRDLSWSIAMVGEDLGYVDTTC